jgi:hypothetical protein
LPFAFARYVTVVASTKSEERKEVCVVVVVVVQIVPRLIIERGDLSKRRWPKLSMFGKKPDNLRRVEITNDALASSPVVAITVFPKPDPTRVASELSAKDELFQECLSGPPSRRLPKCTGILVRVAIITSCWWRIVGIEMTSCELNSGAIEELVEKSSIS